MIATMQQHHHHPERDLKNPTFEDRYEFVTKIGSGAFGTVGEYLDRENKFERVAIKVLPRDEREYFQQEVTILSQLSKVNPYVTTMKHSFEENGFCYLVMKRADRTLKNFLHFHVIDTSLCLHIARQIALGLQGIHSIGYIHTDIKPENIVIYDDLSVQVIDFGSCVPTDYELPANDPDPLYVTTRWYRAPEVILATENYMTTQIDMWALGCIIVEMLTGVVLFPSCDEEEQMAMIEIFIGPVPTCMLMSGTNTSVLYADRFDVNTHALPDLKKPNVHARTRWMKHTKACWTEPTDAYDMSDFVLFARLDQSHIFDGLESMYFRRTINWAAYLNALYTSSDYTSAAKLRRVIRGCLAIDPEMRTKSHTVVDML